MSRSMPDGKVAAALLARFGSVRRGTCDELRNAVDALRRMPDASVHVGRKSVATQVNLLCRWGLPYEALHVFKAARDRDGVHPRRTCYDALLRGFAWAGARGLFEETLREMDARGFSRNAYIANAELRLAFATRRPADVRAAWAGARALADAGSADRGGGGGGRGEEDAAAGLLCFAHDDRTRWVHLHSACLAVAGGGCVSFASAEVLPAAAAQACAVAAVREAVLASKRRGGSTVGAFEAPAAGQACQNAERLLVAYLELAKGLAADGGVPAWAADAEESLDNLRAAAILLGADATPRSSACHAVLLEVAALRGDTPRTWARVQEACASAVQPPPTKLLAAAAVACADVGGSEAVAALETLLAKSPLTPAQLPLAVQQPLMRLYGSLPSPRRADAYMKLLTAVHAPGLPPQEVVTEYLLRSL
eukprot:Rhum_TRINITY_DN14343_c10_g2::Rhum_TRINITY_DN14343_c10_g2_i1::g.83776::m.83776